MKRALSYVSLALLALLSACLQAPELPGNPNAEISFDICKKALEQPSESKAYQGYGGWFFFTLDLKERYPLYQQTAFFTELSGRLEAKGTSLIMLPVTGRALVRPDRLYIGDPVQINFDLEQANRAYKTFLDTLKRNGVQVFDTLEAARSFDASGGQTFFSRDLHWRSQGAKAIFEGVAKQVRQTAPSLPTQRFILERRADDLHHGQFIEKWTTRNCGYRLPGEIQGTHTVLPEATGDSSSEVVLVGSSFSRPPYGYDFLAVALQSKVLNVAYGAGGARESLSRYLRGNYQTHQPRVIVWEFPVYAPAFTPREQEEILSLVQ